jgi:hypothetical protein
MKTHSIEPGALGAECEKDGQSLKSVVSTERITRINEHSFHYAIDKPFNWKICRAVYVLSMELEISQFYWGCGVKTCFRICY